METGPRVKLPPAPLPPPGFSIGPRSPVSLQVSALRVPGSQVTKARTCPMEWGHLKLGGHVEISLNVFKFLVWLPV